MNSIMVGKLLNMDVVKEISGVEATDFIPLYLPDVSGSLLKSNAAYWSPDDLKMQEALKLAPEQMTLEQLLLVTRELDRRFMQLWDKVTFEKDKKLVDYSGLPGYTKPTYKFK